MSTKTKSSMGWGLTPAPGATVNLPAHGGGGPLPEIVRGRLMVLRQFDVADEIDLARLEKLAESGREGLRRVRSTALSLSAPPVAVSLGLHPVQLGGERLEVDVYARFFDFGVVSLRLWLALPEGTPWARLSSLVREAQDSEALTSAARAIVAPVVERLSEAMTGRHESEIFEDYVVACVERFTGDVGAMSLPRDAIAKLLVGEPEHVQLSEAEIEEATSRRSSYTTTDLCVCGWNTALVVDPEGDTDPLDVIELANAQLLELRYYDAMLDHELGRLYDETASRKSHLPALVRNYGPVLRRAMAVMLEIAEFIERVENSLKIIGDVYLARLYAGAVSAIRIPAWEVSVTRKQELVQQIYNVLKAEVDSSRDQLLELTIVLLIVFEIVMAFL